MKHKHTQTVLLYRVVSTLCGAVVLLIVGALGCVPTLSADAVDKAIDVVVHNAGAVEISFNQSDPEYNFNLSLGLCQKITRHVTVTTNSPSGYTLYLRGGNESALGSNTLTNPTYSTASSDIFKSVTAASTCDTMKNGNNWGYALAETASASTFNAIPASDTQIATSSSMTGTYPVTVAVAAYDAAAATYTGSLVFTAVTEPAPTYFAIYYNDGESGTFTKSEYTGSDASHAFAIPSSTPTREGYTFLGWSLSENATSATFMPGGSITVYREPTTGQYGPAVTLYAVWQVVPSNGPSQAPMRSAPLRSGSANSGSDGQEAMSEDGAEGYLSPKGVREDVDIIENLAGNGTLIPAIAALTVASIATGGFIFFIVAKRDDDDEEEEEEEGGVVE